jgi:hypothetical protein
VARHAVCVGLCVGLCVGPENNMEVCSGSQTHAAWIWNHQGCWLFAPRDGMDSSVCVLVPPIAAGVVFMSQNAVASV